MLARSEWEEATKPLTGIAVYQHRIYWNLISKCAAKNWFNSNDAALLSARLKRAKQRRITLKKTRAPPAYV